MSSRLDRQFIDASDVVVDITGVTSRDEMPQTNARTKDDPYWLAQGIYSWIVGASVLYEGPLHDVVLAGVREPEVHKGLILKGAKISVIELWCPRNERYARVKRGGKVESYSDFLQHDQNELSIGLSKLLAGNPTFVTTHYTPEETVEEILTRTKGQLCG